MSKRSKPDSHRSDNQPPTKKVRYNYDHVSEHNNDIDGRENLFLSTRKPIKSNIKIESEIPIPKPDEFCPLNWFIPRLHNPDEDVNDFFNILPYEEANSIFEKLLMYNNGNVTLTNNLINTLNTMQQITQEIHKQTLNSSSKLINNKKGKKRFVEKQNEVFNTINIEKLHTDHQNYIDKTKQIMNKYNNINNDYKSYENERHLIWKSLSNSNDSITPPLIINNNNNILIETKTDYNNIYQNDFISYSSTDHESDEDFEPHKKQNTKQQKKRKKKKKQKLKLRIDNDVGKNPRHNENMDPDRFWDKFSGYILPTNPNNLNSIIPYLQSDIFPTQIPQLPIEKTFVTKAYNFDMYDNELSFDNFSENDNNSNSNSNNESVSNNNELYFAEMPKHYEYFFDKKCYIDEELNIESHINNKYLKQRALYKHYPSQSLYAHSFDQRILSSIVHECDGLSHMEFEIDENKWKEIGSKKVIEEGRQNYETLKTKKNKSKQDFEKLQNHPYRPVEMIEPVVKYVTSIRNNNMRRRMTFEKALRNEICKYVYDGDWNEINKIVNMSWNKRQDDECCTVIKSLDGVLERMCYDKQLNHIDTNVKIGKEIVEIMHNEYETNVQNFNAWKDFDTHIKQIENHHVNSNGEFIVDEQTLMNSEWRNYFRRKQSLPVDRAIEAIKQKRFVQTKSNNKD